MLHVNKRVAQGRGLAPPLLRAIAGFVTPRSGRIVVDGRDITHLPPEARQTAMGYVFRGQGQ